jgi:hypothetical protein
METVTISDLRADLITYLKKAHDGNEVVVTSKGQVLATIVAPNNKFKQAKAELKQLAKTAIIHDIVTPTGEQWNVQS